MKNIQSTKKQKSYYHQHKKTKYSGLRFLSLAFILMIFASSLWFLKPQINEYSKNWFKNFEQEKMAASVQQPKLVTSDATLIPQVELKTEIFEQIIPVDTSKIIEEVKIDSPLINQKPDFKENQVVTVAIKKENQENDFEKKSLQTKVFVADTTKQVVESEKSNRFEALAAQYYPKNGFDKANTAQVQFNQLLGNLAQYPKNKKIMYQLMDEILEQKDHAYFKQVGEIKFKLSRLVR
jgi:hypothetical protein